jgi:hypothetical protein
MGYRWRFTFRYGCRVFFPKGICSSIRWKYVYRIRPRSNDNFYNFKSKAKIKLWLRGAHFFITWNIIALHSDS